MPLRQNLAISLAALPLAAPAATAVHADAAKKPPAVKNIVLVHGAWVDGSGWKPVYDILKRDASRSRSCRSR